MFAAIGNAIFENNCLSSTIPVHKMCILYMYTAVYKLYSNIIFSKLHHCNIQQLDQSNCCDL